MSRTLLAAIGGAIVGAVAIVALLAWVSGPRAAIPAASAAALPTDTLAAQGLPNPRLTPGSVNPNVTQANIGTTICISGWTSTVRPPSAYTSALKLVQIVEYGYPDRDPSHYEEDHLVPLELGGAPRDPRNLWPEPKSVQLSDGTAVGADAKDHLEDALRADVCGGSLSLDEAQRLIAGNWIEEWEAAGRP